MSVIDQWYPNGFPSELSLSELIQMTEDKVEGLRQVVKVQGMKGNWNVDDYSLGMFNGLELALAILEERDPSLRTKEDQTKYNK